jgi:hypothetical protein
MRKTGAKQRSAKIGAGKIDPRLKLLDPVVPRLQTHGQSPEDRRTCFGLWSNSGGQPRRRVHESRVARIDLVVFGSDSKGACSSFSFSDSAGFKRVDNSATQATSLATSGSVAAGKETSGG